MLNIRGISRPTNDSENISEHIPVALAKAIRAMRSGNTDHLIIRGVPTTKNLAHTPLAIQDRSNHPSAETRLMQHIASEFGAISSKGIENTIRFTLPDGRKNEETWHGHFQHKYSLLLCLKGDRRARTYIESANWIMRDAGALSKELTTKRKFFAEQPPFALIETLPRGFGFSPLIFDRSDFEANIKDLDLPDALKKLRRIKENTAGETRAAIEYLIRRLTHPKISIVYRPGDLAIFDERSTIRFSPSYKPSKPEIHQRWMLAASISK